MGIAGFSVSRLADGLIERGLIWESAPIVHGRGQPAAGLHLSSRAAFSLGVSVMTDAMDLVLLGLSGAPLCASTVRLNEPTLHLALDQVESALAKMSADGGMDLSRLVGAGLSITGFFVGQGHLVNPPAPLDDWALCDLEAAFRARLGCQVWLENDGNAAALGEAMVGAGLTYSSFAYLFFASGFGGGVVVDQALMRGRHGNAGEFGGCLPKGMAVPSLERLRQLVSAAEGRESGLADLLETFDLSRPGVDAWLEEAGQALTLIASAISGVLDPDAIILGGRLPQPLAEALIPFIRLANPERRGYARPSPHVAPAVLGSDAAAIGAATLPLRAAFFS
jgi:predicted NBD/HSP70 family sugar kinase